MSLLALVTAAVLLNPVLNPVTTVSVPGVTYFNARNHFVVDTSEDAQVRIVWLGENFKKRFLNKVEQNLPATELATYTLTREYLDTSIRDELGDKAETSLFHLWYLLSQHGRGQQSGLLMNGTKIFYIRDTDGELWAVPTRWDADYDGWSVGTRSVFDRMWWNAGNQVVSRE